MLLKHVWIDHLVYRCGQNVRICAKASYTECVLWHCLPFKSDPQYYIYYSLRLSSNFYNSMFGDRLCVWYFIWIHSNKWQVIDSVLTCMTESCKVTHRVTIRRLWLWPGWVYYICNRADTKTIQAEDSMTVNFTHTAWIFNVQCPHFPYRFIIQQKPQLF